MFGGYRSVSYPDNDGYNADPTAFIFSITDKIKLNQIAYPTFAIYSYTGTLTVFGNGNDIHIHDEAD